MLNLPILILSLICSGWLIVRDCRRRRGVSPAVWVPTFLLLMLASRPPSSWLSGGSLTYSAGVTDELFMFLVLSGSLVIAISRRVNWIRFIGGNLPLMALYLFFAISMCWSGDPMGSITRIFKDFALLFVASVILTESDPLGAIRAVYYRCACVLFPLSVVFIKYYPSFGRGYDGLGQPMCTGVTPQKNTLGEMVLIFSLILLFDYIEVRQPRSQGSRMHWDYVVLMGMAVWLLHMSQSKSALICTVVGATLVLRSGWLASRTVNALALLGALSLPFLVLLTPGDRSLFTGVVQGLGRNMTFTGRTDIWAHITLGTVNPMIGNGYWNFWGGPGGHAIATAMKTSIPNSHNGYLDIYLDGGFVALTLLFFMLVAYGRRLGANTRASAYERLRFAMLVVLIIYNLSESIFARITTMWFTGLLLIIWFPSLRRVAERTGTEPGLASTCLSEDHQNAPEYAGYVAAQGHEQ